MTRMATSLLQPPVWIDRYAALERLAGQLLRETQVAVDTESNSLYAYQEQVCLIQISTAEKDYLIDPLAIDSLDPLAGVFSRAEIEKIFHAAEYDVICLKRDFGFEIHHLFDTMHASRILGRENVGLAGILEQEFQIELNKQYQRANWGRRPLPPEMLAYARLDSHYLIDLRTRLEAELHQRGRWELAQEDFCRLENTEVPPQENGNAVWRIPGAHDLNAAQLTVLKSLVQYRDQQARMANLPVFKVLSNQVLYEIARGLPQTRPALESLGMLNGRLLQRHGDPLLQAVQRGLREPPLTRAHTQRPSDAYLTRLDALRSWRKQTAESLEVPSDVVLPRDVLESIAQSCPATLEELRGQMNTIPWRYQNFGSEILRIIRP